MMLLQPLVLRTGRGRLRPIWAAAHSIAILVVHAWVGRTIAGREVYLKGGFGFGEPIYGVSDVDMIIVLAIDPAHPGANRETARRRWKRLCRLLPPLGKLFQVFFYEDAELHELEAHTYLTYGLGDARDDHNTRPAFLGTRPPQDDVRLPTAPGSTGRAGTGAAYDRPGEPPSQSPTPFGTRSSLGSSCGSCGAWRS